MGLSDDFIGSAFKAGVEAGAQSAGSAILNSAGKALLKSISPELSNFLFGGTTGPSQDTKLILDRLDDLNAGLSERMRILLDNGQDQFDAELIAQVKTNIEIYTDWAKDNLLTRIDSNQKTSDVSAELELSSNTIQSFIEQESQDTDFQLRRLSLLELQISAVQVAVLAERGYDTSVAISQYCSDNNNCIESLTDAEIDTIRENLSESHKRRIYQETLKFYDRISEKGYIKNFVEKKIHPTR